MIQETVAETEMAAFAARIAGHLEGADVVYLTGGLGAGKTALVRGMLRALGETGSVRSPTYTLVEPYHLDGVSYWHFDLYRIEDPQELELIGARECFSSDTICFIEWPDRGQGCVPAATLAVHIEVIDDGARRQITVTSEDNRF